MKNNYEITIEVTKGGRIRELPEGNNLCKYGVQTFFNLPSMENGLYKIIASKQPRKGSRRLFFYCPINPADFHAAFYVHGSSSSNSNVEQRKFISNQGLTNILEHFRIKPSDKIYLTIEKL